MSFFIRNDKQLISQWLHLMVVTSVVGLAIVAGASKVVVWLWRGNESTPSDWSVQSRAGVRDFVMLVIGNHETSTPNTHRTTTCSKLVFRIVSCEEWYYFKEIHTRYFLLAYILALDRPHRYSPTVCIPVWDNHRRRYCQPRLVTNSILLCCVFTIKDQCMLWAV